MWKFTRSPTDLASNEHIVDIEKLLELALLIKRRSGDAILTMGRHATPVLGAWYGTDHVSINQGS